MQSYGEFIQRLYSIANSTSDWHQLDAYLSQAGICRLAFEGGETSLLDCAPDEQETNPVHRFNIEPLETAAASTPWLGAGIMDRVTPHIYRALELIELRATTDRLTALLNRILSLQGLGVAFVDSQGSSLLSLNLSEDHYPILTLEVTKELRVADVQVSELRFYRLPIQDSDFQKNPLVYRLPLSKKENELVLALLRNESVKSYAQTTKVSTETIKTQLRSVSDKLSVSGQVELMLYIYNEILFSFFGEFDTQEN